MRFSIEQDARAPAAGGLSSRRRWVTLVAAVIGALGALVAAGIGIANLMKK